MPYDFTAAHGVWTPTEIGIAKAWAEGFIWTPDKVTGGYAEVWGIPKRVPGMAIRDDCDGYALGLTREMLGGERELRKALRTGEVEILFVAHDGERRNHARLRYKGLTVCNINRSPHENWRIGRDGQPVFFRMRRFHWLEVRLRIWWARVRGAA